MKIGFIFTIAFLLLACGKHESIADDETGMFRKDYFSLTEFVKKTDSLKNIAVIEGHELLDAPEYNPHYLIGNIHFMIANEELSFNVINKSVPYGDCDCTYKEDSLFYVNFSIESIESAKKIKTHQIINILQ